MYRSTRTIIAVTLSAVVALSMSACGGESAQGAESPEEAVTAFLISADGGDYDDACSWLTQAAQADIAANVQGDCATAMPTALQWFDFDDDGIGSHSDTSLWTSETTVQESGTRAKVHVVLHNGGDSITLHADRTDVGWQVSTLESQR